MTVTQAEPARTSVRLWDRDFSVFWSGQLVSLVGSQVTAVALPLVAVLTLRASEVEIGVLQACVFLPFLGLPLLAGVVVDRHRKRPIMLAANAIRAVLIAMVPLLAWLGGLSLPLLCAVALAAGACAVLFEVAEMAYLPLLVGRDRLTAANSATIAASSAATLTGPGLGGFLVGVAGPAMALLVDAASYVVSLLTLGAVRHREAAPVRGTERHLRAEIVAGLRAVVANPPVRLIAVQGFAFNLLNQGFLVAFMLYAIREVGVDSTWYGVVLAVQGGGSVLGAAVAARLATRFGYGRTYVVGAVLDSAPLALVACAALAGSVAVTIAAWLAIFAVAGFGVGVANVLSYTLRQALTPDELLGRMNASMRLILYAGIPVGAVTGGALAAVIGPAATATVAALGMVVAVAIVLPLRRLHAMPSPQPVD